MYIDYSGAESSSHFEQSKVIKNLKLYSSV